MIPEEAHPSDEYEAWVDARVDYSRRLEECLAAAGLVVTREDPLHLSSAAPGMSEAQHREIVDACRNELGPRPELRFDAEAANATYDRYLRVAGCIEAEGHTPDPPPSREAFVEAYGSQELSWNPWRGWTTNVSATELQRVRDLCNFWK